MVNQMRRVGRFGILSLFFVLVFTNSVWAIWVDADGSGKESINISTNTGNSEYPSLYLDSSRNPHIAWFDSTEVDEEIYFLKWNGTEWVDADGSGKTSINISKTVGSSYQPSLCLDGSGKPHIAWKNYTPGNYYEIYYLKWNGSEWVDADGWGQGSINISNTSTDSFHASLCLDSLGKPHIAWFEAISGNSEIYYLQWSGTSWVDADGSGKEGINISNNPGDSKDPVLYLDSSGKPHIAWHDDTSGNEEIYYLKWNGSEWVDADGSGQGEINVSKRPGDSGYASLCLDSLDNPHIAWYDYASGKNEIYYLKWNGIAWVDADGSGQGEINVSNTTGISNYPSLYLDVSDNPHIAWHNSSGLNDIYYLKWNGIAWVDADGSGKGEINISANDGDSSYPSLYLDASGNPHIAWKDNTSGNYDIYYLKWNDGPVLSWTGETNYSNDGLHPQTGYRDTDFIYRVKYMDVNNDGPKSGYPKLHIMKGGSEIGVFTMDEVDPGDTTYSNGKLYTYTKSGLVALGDDYTYYFEAKDIWNTPATGAPTSSQDGPDVINRAPTLSWTEETNYASDGLDPEVGPRETSFVYKVKYTDEDNDLPAAGYPKLHIKKGGTPISGSPFPMSPVDLGDNNYADGKLYAYTKIGLEPGTDYTYYFEANDVWNIPATGDPTNPVDGPDVANILPTLSWTGETNYASDGLDPEIGPRGTSFVYRVKYTDEENDAPASGYPELHIRKGGLEISGSPFTMDEVNSGDKNYNDGKLYTYTKSGLTPGENYTYYFEAKDLWDGVATGDPTNPVDAPDVTNIAPTLSWTGETNYTSDGLNPETGYPDTNFTYRVIYADTDNDAPASGYPKLHIKKAGKEISGSPFAMSEVNAGDKDYTDGKVYASAKSGLAPGEDYTYYFEAKDLWDGAATGDPTNPLAGPDVGNLAPTLSWTGETNYTEDGLDPEVGSHYTDFIYRVKYADPNNDVPASGYPRLHIKKGGIEIEGSPFTMREVNTGDKNYRDGKLYTYTKGRLPMGMDYTYHFQAKDCWNSVATGDPTSAIDAPDVLIGFSAIGEVKIQGGENGYVNPLKGEEAEIHFWPSTQGTVNVEIFDLIGLLVWEKSKAVTGAQDSIKWDCRNNENGLVASGIYVVFVKGPGINATKKVAVMK